MSCRYNGRMPEDFQWRNLLLYKFKTVKDLHKKAKFENVRGGLTVEERQLRDSARQYLEWQAVNWISLAQEYGVPGSEDATVYTYLEQKNLHLFIGERMSPNGETFVKGVDYDQKFFPEYEPADLEDLFKLKRRSSAYPWPQGGDDHQVPGRA